MAYFRAFSRVDWSRLTLAELRSTTCGLEAVLARLFALNPRIYLVFELRHPRFPHPLTADKSIV